MKLYNNVAKRLKLKVRKFCELIPTFAEFAGGKLGDDLSQPLPPPPSWIGLRENQQGQVNIPPIRIRVNISNYKSFHEDKNKYDGGLLFYLNENVPCKVINDDIEI